MVWFACDDAVGSPGDADTMSIEVTDDGIDWVEVAVVTADVNQDGSIDSDDDVWSERSFRVSEFVDPSSVFQCRFVVSDAPNNSVTEAGVDEFTISQVTCEDSEPCAGDINGDSVVNGSDLAVLLADWGVIGSIADVNNDGTVGGADLAELLSNWGACP